MIAQSFNKHFRRNLLFIAAFAGLIAVIAISQPPKDFPARQVDIHVPKGASISEAAQDLYDKKIISSPLLFKAFSVILSKNRGIFAGDYRFVKPQNLVTVAYRLVKGHQGQEKVQVTIPEGTNVYDMAYIYLKKLSDFNAPRFVALAQPYEGYLYPDTYYFLANATPEEIISTMRANFNEKVMTLDKEIKAFGKPLDEIITMASIIEKEGYADDSRKIIAGILWKRLSENMYLQVDAPFYYITGKAGGFTLDDLKIKSPYNTYLNKGLPQGPISNPSLDTIRDTVTPTKTSYYFYLTGSDGIMRYATTFVQHVANRNTYLK